MWIGLAEESIISEEATVNKRYKSFEPVRRREAGCLNIPSLVIAGDGGYPDARSAALPGNPAEAT